jgi:pilus assembly protein CpaE
VRDLNFVRLAGEVNSPEELTKLLNNGNVSLVFFHLDPRPDAVVEVIEQVSAKYSDLAMIALSHKTDPESILAPMRAGCDQFVCEPIDAGDLSNAVTRVASRRLSAAARSRTICVMGASGGAGATTIACNLALEIGHIVDRDCALVDLDMQFGDVAVNFDVEPRFNIFDLADGGTEIDKAIVQSTLHSMDCKVALLGRPELVEQHEAITPDMVHRVLEVLNALYENVVIDLPRHATPTTLATVMHADVVLIVCQLLVPSIRNAKRCLEFLRRAGVQDDRLEVVINRGDSRSSRLTEADLESTIRKKPYGCVPNDYQFVARSIDIGKPIAALDRNSPVRAAIRQIAKKVLSGHAQAPSAGSADQRRGFLSRLLAK